MPTRYKGSARDVRALDAFIKLMRASESLTLKLNRALGAKLLRSNANMTTVLDNLEREGFIRREKARGDRRVTTISLTPDGKRRIEKVFPHHAARIAESMGVLSASEQEELGRLCKKLGLEASKEPTT